MIKLFFIILLSTASLLAQTDWEKWEKKDFVYAVHSENSKRNYSLKYESISQFISKAVILSYWVLFSDLDGDNCPYHPTCSNFLLGGIRESNIVQGGFMFFDRFTRDSNIFFRSEKYARYKSGRFYDSYENYLLDESRIKYHPPGTIVTEE